MITDRMRALSALLILLLVLTGKDMAMARGHAAGAGVAVLCSGQGLILVTLDARGQPTGAPQYCPDAVAALWAPPLPAVPQPQARLVRPTEPGLPARGVLKQAPLGTAQARAPPVPV